MREIKQCNQSSLSLCIVLVLRSVASHATQAFVQTQHKGNRTFQGSWLAVTEISINQAKFGPVARGDWTQRALTHMGLCHAKSRVAVIKFVPGNALLVTRAPPMELANACGLVSSQSHGVARLS